MKLPVIPVHSLEDVTLNFERLEGHLSVPVFTQAPLKPEPGELYLDTTLVKLRYWTGAAWVSL